jgi:hypothetical protein
MSRVQEIKDPIGEYDVALIGAPGDGGVQRSKLRGGVQRGCVALGWNAKL